MPPHHGTRVREFLLAAAALAFVTVVAAAERISLFDGKTLTGWEGDPAVWRVADGAITGGSLDEKVPRNNFVATTRSFQNFDLRLKLKLSGTEGFINSGVQFRSVRLPGTTEMYGYQADAGTGWWGKLYDESRRKKVVAELANPAAVQAAVKEGDWNDYHIRTEGPHVQIWINNVLTIDYTESDPGIPQDGLIGIQVHGGGKALVQARDITIEELAPTPGAPTWDKVGRPSAPPPTAKKKK